MTYQSTLENTKDTRLHELDKQTNVSLAKIAGSSVQDNGNISIFFQNFLNQLNVIEVVTTLL